MFWKAAGLLFALEASAAIAGAQGSAPAWQLIGQAGGPTQAVAVQGKYAYVGVGFQLNVLDVSDPAAPRQVGGSAPFADFVQDVAVSGTVAYVAAGSELLVLDVSDPTHPALIGSLKTRGFAEGVAVSGTIVCLADGPYGLRVIDVSKPANPTEIGSAFTRNYAFKVAVAGNYAYVAAAGAGLLIADLTNPAKPAQDATLATPGYAYGLAVSGNTVYVAGGWEGLATVDVAVKTAPRLLGQYKTEGWAKGVTVSGNLAYVAAALSGLLVVDVSSPAAPAEVGSLAVVGGDAAGVAVAGTIAYVADRNWGLEAVSLSVPASPAQVGFYGPLGYADGVTVAGNYAYVAAGTYGLRIVDISDPAHPEQVGAYDTQSYAKSVAVVGKYAYVGTAQGAGLEGLHVVDVSDPARPTRVGFLFDGYGTRDMALASGVVYIADEDGLWLIDVSDPTAPKTLSHFEPGGVGVDVSGNVAYVARAQQGLITVDVSNPSAPAVIGQLQWPNAGAQHVAVGQGKAFVADSGALTVLDVSNPRTPVWLASYPISGFAEAVTLAGEQVFLAGGGGGLSVIDVSNPASPVLVWSYGTPGYADSVFVDGDYAYIGDLLGGLLVLAGPQAQPMASPGKVAAAAKTAPPGVRASVKPAGSARASSVQAASSCVVTSTADSGPGTLRNCLDNSSSGTTITFDTMAFPPSRPATINLLSALPSLGVGNVTIDASNAGVILDGSSAGGMSGLNITSDGNSIKGLQIVHFVNAGIGIQGNGNLIGGSRSRGNGPLGEGTLISSNGSGIGMGPADNNIIAGNFIGTDITGTIAMGNGTGIGGACVSNNRIGGNSPGEGNVISGNTGYGGVAFNGSSCANSANVIIGNYIGVDASGTKDLSNASRGIALEGGTNSSLVQGNVIVSSGGGDIVISDWGSTYNTVVGNLLGTDASGKVAVGSTQYGICACGGFTRIGGTTPADRNVIAQGAIAQGDVIFGGRWGQPGSLVIGNFLGTDISGSVALAGSGPGVILPNGSVRPFVGGTTPGERNVIGGNPSVGIQVETDYAFIGGNYIGTDASGQFALGNGSSDGVWIGQGTHNIVEGNLIATHHLAAGVTVNGSAGNTIRQNLIYDNQGGGIVLSEGGNAGISSPVIAGVNATGVSGTACPGCEVEIFSDSDDEGRVFEGSAFAGLSGAFAFDEGNPLTGPNITATATDINGNTSQFSASVAAPSPPPSSPPVIAIAPSTLQFAYSIGGAVPAGQSVQVTKTGGGGFIWNASWTAAWLSATPASDMAPSIVTVSVAPGGLATGTYSGIITVSATGVASQTVIVTLAVSAPVVSISGVVNAASFQPGISPGAWISIFGANLASTTRSWRSDEIVNGVLPTQLDGVSVTIDGKPAAVSYISPTQLNVQVPDDSAAGAFPVRVTAPLGSASGTAQIQPFSPGLFTFDGKYLAAQHADYSYVGEWNLLSGVATAPAQPGEVIILWGTGLGPSNPATPAGQLVTQASPLANQATVFIGGVQSPNVQWAGISGAGLWQINVQVPSGLPDGDALVAAQVGGSQTQGNAFITIQQQ